VNFRKGKHGQMGWIGNLGGTSFHIQNWAKINRSGSGCIRQWQDMPAVEDLKEVLEEVLVL